MKLKKTLLLGSQSPRRQDLLRQLGLDFIIKPLPVKEDYPSTMKIEEIPGYLARKKADVYGIEFNAHLVLTADTIVTQGNDILGKPENENEASKMLKQLSGKTHRVITGVCLKSEGEYHIIQDITDVKFKKLYPEEIDYYIKHYMPMDKAGAYGIQEWIGMIGIEKINGSYFNVVGLPVYKIYAMLRKLDLLSLD